MRCAVSLHSLDVRCDIPPADVIRRKIQLFHRRVPNPEWRPVRARGNDGLTAENSPRLEARNASPSSPTRFEQRVPCARRFTAQPQVERFAGSSARPLRNHPPPVAILRQKGMRITADRLLLQQAPILLVFP